MKQKIKCFLGLHRYQIGAIEGRDDLRFRQCMCCDYFAIYSRNIERWVQLNHDPEKLYNFHTPLEAEKYLDGLIYWWES